MICVAHWGPRNDKCLYFLGNWKWSTSLNYIIYILSDVKGFPPSTKKSEIDPHHPWATNNTTAKCGCMFNGLVNPLDPIRSHSMGPMNSFKIYLKHLVNRETFCCSVMICIVNLFSDSYWKWLMPLMCFFSQWSGFSFEWVSKKALIQLPWNILIDNNLSLMPFFHQSRVINLLLFESNCVDLWWLYFDHIPTWCQGHINVKSDMIDMFGMIWCK
jgi:hypothetical protein